MTLRGWGNFDRAWAGERESDLARLALWVGMTGGPFWSATGAIRYSRPPSLGAA